jgi:anti-sigma regulatory factor (Ser/Thr protein kinase)
MDTARLLVSELVTNAVLHGQGEITLDVCLGPDALRVEVRDQGGGFAHDVRRPGAPIVGGWGLQAVSMQSTRLGYQRGERPRVVRAGSRRSAGDS